MPPDASPPIARPLAVIKGWRSFERNAEHLARAIRERTAHDERSCRAFGYRSRRGIPAIAREIATRLADTWPDADELDIAGISMGGLIARHIAAHPPHPQTPRIRTLYTLATPHRGARLARVFHFIDPAAAQMAPGSGLLRDLDRALLDPERRPRRIVAFSRTRDWWVGTANTTPAAPAPADGSHTVAAPPHTLAHLLVTYDRTIPRLIADDINAPPA